MSGKVTNRIVYLLKERGKQDKDLCRYIGVAQSTFVNWKNRGTDPRPKYLSKIAEFFDVTVDYLLTGDDRETDSASISINDELSKILQSLDADTALYPSGRLPETPEERDLIAASLKTVMAHVETLDRAMNKSDKKD